jgi:hypothetical protein
VSNVTAVNATGSRKPGPKGRVLEPYAKGVLLMHREGKSMQDIVNWLSQPPRNVTITRQAVHAWVTARIRKLVKLHAAYANTGFGGPFQENKAVLDSRPLEKANGLDPPRLESLRPAASSRLSTEQLKTGSDDSEFRVDELDIKRAKNPLSFKP